MSVVSKVKNKINSVPKVIYFIIILFLVITQPIYYKYNQWMNKVQAYNITRTTDDLTLTIENFKFIAMGNGLYIEPTWSVRTSKYNKDKIQDVELVAYINNKKIMNSYVAKEINNSNPSEGVEVFIHDIKVNDDSILNIRLSYILNGEKKEFSEELNLKAFKVELAQWYK